MIHSTANSILNSMTNNVNTHNNFAQLNCYTRYVERAYCIDTVHNSEPLAEFWTLLVFKGWNREA